MAHRCSWGAGVVVQDKSVRQAWWVAPWPRLGAVAQWTLACWLVVALVTYHPVDEGWTQSGIGVPPYNADGRWGAWLSDALLGIFGPAAWLIPAFLFKAPLRPRRSTQLIPYPYRVLALLVALVSLAVLLRLNVHIPSGFLGNGSGGLVGEVLGMAAWHAWGNLGSTIVFLGCLLISMVLGFELDMMFMTEWLGRWLIRLGVGLREQTWDRLLGWWHDLHSKRSLRRDFEREQEQFALHITNPKVKRQIKSETPAAQPSVAHRSHPAVPEPEVSRARAPEPEVGILSVEPSDAFDLDQWSMDDLKLPDADLIHAKLSTDLPVEPVAKAPSIIIPPAPRPIVSQPSLFDVLQAGSLLPSVQLLDQPDRSRKRGYSEEALESLSRLLELKLREFNIQAEVTAVHPGPVITRFEIQPAAGVKVARISNIAKDLARSLAVIAVRVVEVIPGKSVVGVEIPNESREIVRLSEVLSSSEYDSRESPLTLVLGKDIGGRPVVADLARMPHLLVAGTTGSGKSVGVNAMLLSILYKATPEQVRLIMIDPKMLELSIYDGIPHLLTPVVTDMKDAGNALRWSVAEMERRYKLLSKVGVRNLAGYNKKIREAIEAGTPIRDPLWRRQDTALQDEPPFLEPLPFIVVVVDEFADLMMVVGKKVEELIARIAQKARAAGIHLILATQRPSVDVITGLIKANIPTRIAFQVSSKIDSRTILDQGGAEQLLGQGDMLFLPPGSGLPERVHGAFVADEEVHRVCDHWRSKGSPEYIDEILEGSFEGGGESGFGASGGEEETSAEQDPLYDQAVAFVLETRRPSASFVQRRFKIGYNRAARLVEAMEEAGVVSGMGSNGQREVLVPNRDH